VQREVTAHALTGIDLKAATAQGVRALHRMAGSFDIRYVGQIGSDRMFR
jgi:hypothetical protein